MKKAYNKGRVSTPDNPCGSKLMEWIRDHLDYPHDYCLIWPFGRDPTGYGCLGRNGKKLYAHRYICELVNGPPPTPKYHAAHSCANGYGGCVNPRHLSWKTPSENQLEGEKHPRVKLTPEAVAEILSTKTFPFILAAKYGVTPATIRKVRKGLIWRASRPAA